VDLHSLVIVQASLVEIGRHQWTVWTALPTMLAVDIAWPAAAVVEQASGAVGRYAFQTAAVAACTCY
jgi:NADPH-dependent curcumin reductase CurA